MRTKYRLGVDAGHRLRQLARARDAVGVHRQLVAPDNTPTPIYSAHGEQLASCNTTQFAQPDSAYT